MRLWNQKILNLTIEIINNFFRMKRTMSKKIKNNDFGSVLFFEDTVDRKQSHFPDFV